MQHDHEYHALEILDVVHETADTRSFVLGVPTELRDSFAYVAGQFCTFRALIDGVSVVRCYSMSSAPDTGDPLTTTVKRVPEGVMSNWMIDTLVPGDTIEAMRPAGLFVLHPTDVPVVAFAGGSGITPVLSIVKSALATTDREIVLVYANRDADSVIFARELDRLGAESDGRLTVHGHLDTERGFLGAGDCATLVGDRGDAQFYVCGPGPYMDTVEAGLQTLGVASSQLFIERFVVPGDVPKTEGSTQPESLVVRLGGRTHTIAYEPGDTILDTTRRASLGAPFSCESGSCATCMAHLDVGSASMRVNNALTPEEVGDDWVLTCQAIPTSSEVVVDYDA